MAATWSLGTKHYISAWLYCTNPCSSGTAPVPGAIQVSADNATTVSSNVVVLGYGCIYQGGYAYAFDDTTPNSGSVGGKVATTSEQAAAYPNGVLWSSNGATSGGSGAVTLLMQAIIYFLELIRHRRPQQARPLTQENGGSAPFTASAGPTNITYYAAGLCKQTIASYSDWYLPAICEMGYRGTGNSPCGDSVAPQLQNIQSSLIDSSAPSGFYCNSTEFSSNRHSAVKF